MLQYIYFILAIPLLHLEKMFLLLLFSICNFPDLSDGHSYMVHPIICHCWRGDGCTGTARRGTTFVLYDLFVILSYSVGLFLYHSYHPCHFLYFDVVCSLNFKLDYIELIFGRYVHLKWCINALRVSQKLLSRILCLRKGKGGFIFCHLYRQFTRYGSVVYLFIKVEFFFKDWSSKKFPFLLIFC